MPSRVMIGQPRKRGRKPVVTPERIEMICGLLAKGESEKSACIRAGIGLTAWNTAKRSNASLRQRTAEARDDWARLRHKQHAAALYESQSTRSANRKALKPQPTRQAKLVAWHLTFRVPLHFAAIPETDIKEACERFGMSLDRWQRQERAFGLLGKVYAKRAKLRGEQAAIATAPMDLPKSGAKLQTNIGVPSGILAGNDPAPDSRPGSPWSMPAGAEAPSDASPVLRAWLEHERPEQET
jgi:hypothetical protein